jgi:hypothetical protein
LPRIVKPVIDHAATQIGMGSNPAHTVHFP